MARNIVAKSTADKAENPAKNLYGQKMGRKGAETRARLMMATANLLEKRSIMDLSVAEIAALAGTSSAAFYVYFDDVPEVALALAENVEQITPEIETSLVGAWDDENALARALVLVKAYIALWQQHHPILRLRNLRADEGDKRFEEVRHASVGRLHALLSARIAAAQNGLDASPGASALMILLERTAAMANLPLSRRHASRSQLIKATAFLISKALTPEPKVATSRKKKR